MIDCHKQQVPPTPTPPPEFPCEVAKYVFTHVFFRVEDRNDPMFQKMRRYIKAFSKEDETEAKTDTLKGFLPTLAQPRLRAREGLPNRKSLTGWQMIRHSALGSEFGQEEPEEDQDIKYV